MREKIVENIIPPLEIVRCSDLLIYEKYDPIRVKKLLRKIPKDKVFINPILVGGVPKLKNFIVLDGANRLEALNRLGIKDIFVQKVNYFNPKEVQLFSNHHYLEKIDSKILKIIRKRFNFYPINRLDKERLLKNNKFIAILRIKRKFFLIGKYKDLFSNVDILNQIVDSYLGKVEIYRFSEFPYLSSMFPVELIFHRFTPSDIVKLAKNVKLLNSGITRHVASVYCLRVDLPLKVLTSKLSLKKKNNLLLNLIHQKIQQKKIRFIASSAYLFDEWERKTYEKNKKHSSTFFRTSKKTKKKNWHCHNEANSGNN